MLVHSQWLNIEKTTYSLVDAKSSCDCDLLRIELECLFAIQSISLGITAFIYMFLVKLNTHVKLCCKRPIQLPGSPFRKEKKKKKKLGPGS